MKKQEQIKANDIVVQFLEKFNDAIDTGFPDLKVERLDYCKAWVANTQNYSILKSYGTIVAVIDKKNLTGYDFLRFVYGYTATSAKHISKFRNRFRGIETWYTWRAV